MKEKSREVKEREKHGAGKALLSRVLFFLFLLHFSQRRMTFLGRAQLFFLF